MSLFAPDDYLTGVTRIDPAELVRAGCAVVLIDIDNTLVPRDTHLLSQETCDWVSRLKEAGLRVCLLSNNWHKAVFAYAERLAVPLVYKAMKPLPFAFFRARRKALQAGGGNGARGRAVVIGDQLMTDVLGAHLLGWQVILVSPLSTTDLWYTLLFRRLEYRLMKGARPRV
jgi:HAD superfamily phosphatase (TIGR01668 family)